jgi:hypothetical protein
MSSVLQRKAIAAVRAWAVRQGKKVKAVKHVHPRVYVIGRTAPGCLIVSRPWQDSAPQCRGFDRRNPLSSIYLFDGDLNAGDWCATGYIVTSTTGETVAVRFDVTA